MNEEQKEILKSKLLRLEYLNRCITRVKEDFNSEAQLAKTIINDLLIEIVNNSVFKDYEFEWIIDFESGSEVSNWKPYIVLVSIQEPKDPPSILIIDHLLKALINQIEETGIKVIKHKTGVKVIKYTL